jgi:hypothetical protein
MGMGKSRIIKTFVAIDPGITGGIARISEDGTCDVFAVPSFLIEGRRSFDVPAMAKLLRSFGKSFSLCMESVHAMPGNGAVSMFFFGRGVGIWEGIFGALGRPFELIPPQSWKKGYPGLAPVKGDTRSKSQRKSAAKKEALAIARRIFPELSEKLSKEKDDGKAEALLIALYFARQKCDNLPWLP